MNVFRDGVIAFFSAVGMTTVVWLLAGAVLHAGRPTIPGLYWYCLCGARRWPWSTMSGSCAGCGAVYRGHGSSLSTAA